MFEGVIGRATIAGFGAESGMVLGCKGKASEKNRVIYWIGRKRPDGSSSLIELDRVYYCVLGRQI